MKLKTQFIEQHAIIYVAKKERERERIHTYMYRRYPKDMPKTGIAVPKRKQWGRTKEVRQKEDLSLNIHCIQFCT